MEHPGACQEYCRRLSERKLLDFDDLLLEVLREYERDPDAFPSKPFRQILVDEFQDCNAVQFKLLRYWSKKNGRLFVIGDPDQSIYGFRGSDPACFSRFIEDEPGAEVISLHKNYRSSGTITELSLIHI